MGLGLQQLSLSLSAPPPALLVVWEVALGGWCVEKHFKNVNHVVLLLTAITKKYDQHIKTVISGI